MNNTARFVRDVILCILFVLTLLGLYAAAAVYMHDPVQPTIPEDVTTDWGNQ